MQEVQEVKREWTDIGSEYSGTDEQKVSLGGKCDSVPWQDVNEIDTLPFSPGAAINALIREFKISNVTHLAISNAMAPLGLYGIRFIAKVTSKPVTHQIFAIDDGVSATVVAFDTIFNFVTGEASSDSG